MQHEHLPVAVGLSLDRQGRIHSQQPREVVLLDERDHLFVELA